LIRDFDDFGVIVIGDPRLRTKAYGRVFMEALPRSPVIAESAIGAVFLAERLAQLRPAPALKSQAP
jgi:ATP-dependent DNA helicase DinG